MEQLVDAAFKSHETFIAWHTEFSRSVPRFKSEFDLYCDRRRHVPNDLDETAEEIRRCDSDDFDDEVEKTPRFSAVPLLKRLCCRAFADVKNRDFESASELLEQARKQLAFCIESKCLRQEYEKGFEYVLKNLELYSSFKEYGGDGWGKRKCKACLKHLGSYDELDSKEKAAVLSVKSFFVRYICSDSYDEQIQICTKLIELDGENFEWYIDAYHPLEKKRTSSAEKSTTWRAPGEDEVKIITDAVKCPGAEFDPNVQALFISCLAQCFKGYPLRFGTENFQSNEQVINFIKSKADRVIALDPMYAGSNSYLRKVFLRHLPYKFQGVKFAWLCAKRALIFRPRSLRVNHGLASIYIRMGMYQKGEMYLMKAYQKDDRCVNAALDLVHVWLRNPSAHGENFARIFKELLRNPSISDFERARVFFAKALQEFVVRQVKEAVDDFYEAYYTDEEATIQEIKAIQGVTRRFRWAHPNNSPTLINELKVLFTSRAEDWPDGTKVQIQAFRTMASALPNTESTDQDWRTQQGKRAFARPRESLYSSASFSNNWRRDASGWSFESAPTNMPWRSSASGNGNQYFWPGSSSNPAIIWLPTRLSDAEQARGRNNNNNNRGQSLSYTRHIDSREIAAAQEILSLPQQNVSEEAINAAYEKIVRNYNPEANRELRPRDHERKVQHMIRVNKAWETLQLRFCYP